MIVLSYIQAEQLLNAKNKHSQINLSLDLGLSETPIRLGENVIFSDDEFLQWETIEEIRDKDNSCFFIENGVAVAIQSYSEEFGRVYTLYPTNSAPTMLVSGIPMHRIKDTNPWEDTISKLKAFGNMEGHVLDTTTGLGYTAILAAEKAAKVTTVEIDPTVREIARKNPWSSQLFTNPKIELVIGDSNDLICEFESNTFEGIIHDPPMFSLAGNLYSLNFYLQAHRILKTRGRMFHYIGNPESRSGSRVTRGVVERLKKAGFSQVIPKPKAFGVLGLK